MKVISIWQPYASLVVHNFKLSETRGWPAPASLIGAELGIASTKTIRHEQRALFEDLEFQKHYAPTGLPALDDLPHGKLLGVARVLACDFMTEEVIEDVTEEQRAFGDWRVGRWAWRLDVSKRFAEPIMVSGKQGLWEFDPYGRIAEKVGYAG